MIGRPFDDAAVADWPILRLGLRAWSTLDPCWPENGEGLISHQHTILLVLFVK